MTSITKEFRINQEIRSREVRLIDSSGEQLGIVPLREALRIAGERELDLVEIAPQAKPSVCRIMDYGKFKYEQSKKDKEARRKQKLVEIKEVKMRPNIEDHDFEVKSRNALRFLNDGDKVKATIMFRGREIVHANLARKLLERLVEVVREVGLVERDPKVEGRNMVMILSPRPDRVVREAAKVEPAEGPADGTAASPGVKGGKPVAEDENAPGRGQEVPADRNG